MRSQRGLPAIPNRRSLVLRRRSAALTIYARGTVRTLSFDPTDRKYEFCYNACVYGDAPKDRLDGKLLGVVLDKLEVVGQLVPLKDEKGNPRSPTKNEIRLYDTPGGGRVVLEEAEYDLLVRRVTAIIPTTMPAFARDVERTLSWLEGLEKQDAAAPAPTGGAESVMAGH